MIFVGNKLRVVDNCGAWKARCLWVPRNCRRIGALVGTLIVINLIEIVPDDGRYKRKKIIEKGAVLKGVIVRSRRRLARVGGFVCSHDHGVVVLEDEKTPAGTRVRTPVFEEIRASVPRIIAISRVVV